MERRHDPTPTGRVPEEMLPPEKRSPMKTKLTPIAAAAAVAIAGAVAAPAFAQTAAAPAAAASAAKVDDVQRVEVTGIRGSLQSAISQKRNAESHVEVITSEDIGKMPDKNVADSLARLPGVT